MPIYEYQCTSCGHPLEVFQKISEEPLLECPVCGKNTLKKLISSTSFQLKGSGWYVTDIRDKNKPKPVTTDEPKTAEKETKTETLKTDSTTPAQEPKKSDKSTDS